MSSTRTTAFISALLLLSAGVAGVSAAEFTADLLQRHGDDTREGRLYVTDTGYRMELREGDQRVVLIVDPESNTTHVLSPGDRQYTTLEMTSPPSLTNDPFAGFRHAAERYERAETGRGEAAGLECGKVVVSSGDQKLFTACVSDDLGFPLRIVLHVKPGGFVELHDIRRGRVHPSLFEMPEGYTFTETPGGGPAPAAPRGPARAVSRATGKQDRAHPANIVFILDASGSMWGEIDGRDKIAIAKDVMAGLIRDLAPETRVGLVAYGHRRKGDCRDVEQLVPLAPVDKGRLIQTVRAISPNGKTPITRSVRLTADTLSELEEAATIILVSDGKETCEGDPCALVRELRESGLRFVLHVIGFDVTATEREQLECMADAGGGSYVTATTADQLQTAARHAVGTTQDAGFLEVRAHRGGKRVSARVDVLRSGTRVDTANTSVDVDDPLVMRLPAGTYDVVVTDEELPGEPRQRFSDVRVEVDQTARKIARFEAGVLELAAVKDGSSIHALAVIYDGDDRITSGWLKEGEGRTFELQPGSYRVTVQDTSIPEEPVVALTDVRIHARRTTSLEASFSREGRLHVEAFRGDRSVHVLAVVFQGDDRVASDWLEAGEGAAFDLLPGTYRVELTDKSIPQEPQVTLDGIRIEPGRTVRKQARFTAEGELHVEVFRGGKSLHVYVTVSEGGDRVASEWLEEGRGAVIKLLPGTYTIKVRGPDRKVTEHPGFTVRSGRTTKADIDI